MRIRATLTLTEMCITSKRSAMYVVRVSYGFNSDSHTPLDTVRLVCQATHSELDFDCLYCKLYCFFELHTYIFLCRLVFMLSTYNKEDWNSISFIELY